jgi:hypothetical protein
VYYGLKSVIALGPKGAMCGRLLVGKENLHQFEGRRLNGAPGTPFVSSNGVKDAVVWVVESNRFADDDGDDSVLHAWNAVTGELLPKTAAQNLVMVENFLVWLSLKAT